MKIVYILLNMNITAAIVGLLILLARKLLSKKAPGMFFYCLWGIVVFRLIVPFSISNELSILSIIKGFIAKVIYITDREGSFRISFANYFGFLNSEMGMHSNISILNYILTAVFIIWIIVAVGLIAAFIIRYIHFYATVKHSAIQTDINNIFVSDIVSTPLVLGIVKPQIIVPANIYNQENLKYIIAHETIHIRRGDNLTRLAAVVLACVNWFNPFVWLFLKKSAEDMEMACDEKVIKGLDDSERKAYASTLIYSATGRSQFLAPVLHNRKIYTRVFNIVNKNRLTMTSMALIIIFMALFAVSFLTNPVK